jgi:hypothetical protein
MKAGAQLINLFVHPSSQKTKPRAIIIIIIITSIFLLVLSHFSRNKSGMMVWDILLFPWNCELFPPSSHESV